jgi:hypothetical protein
MALQKTTLAPADNSKSDVKIVTETMIPTTTVNQARTSASLAALFEENTLAKIIGPAETYLENNVSIAFYVMLFGAH